MTTRSLQLHADAPSKPRGIFLIPLLCTIAASLLLPQELRAQNLTAATRPAPEHRVLLMWGGDTSGTTIIGYNVYRKPGAAPAYPTTPLNAARIAPVTDTTAFKAIIPRFSDDWNTIAFALADTTGPGGSLQPLANVFAITTLPVGSERWQRVQILAMARPTIAQAMGQAFNDLSAVNGTQYNYRLVRVGPGGTELPPASGSEITITAGTPAPIPLPVNVRAVTGDAKIQVLWNKPPGPFASFTVVRATAFAGPYRKVNETDISGDLTHDLDSAALSPVAHGYTDYERWDSAGFPAPRTVSGNPLAFTGPANATRYWYKVQLKDILGNAGPLSGPVSGMPIDRTPPAVPANITVDAIEPNSSFRIRWSKVQLDVEGHRESRVSYRVYRYVTGLHPDSGAVNVPPVITAPLVNDSLVFTASDSTMGLRSTCLDSTLFYRVEARDSMGNVSRRSIAVGAALKDITPPAIVKGTAAEGFDDFIRVKWELNTDCGVENYLIYRSLCDRGDWIPCRTFKDQNGVIHEVSTNSKRDCGGPFAFIGSITAADAKALGPIPHFDDHSVPPGSPLCYAYLIKAQDHAQNISGSLPVPLNTEIIVCEHLRDRTPPEPAIIAGLMARDSAIQVDFIGQPVQDIAAYHVYRAEARTGPFAWVGGVTVVPPPGTGVRLSSPYLAQPTPGCVTIPLVSNPYMSIGTWTDSSADRKRIYWYKVLGVDQSGNQSPPDSALTVSTFTFASNRDTPPKILGVMPADDPCALTVVWTPGFDTTKVKGFFVFRSTSMNGQYYQIEGLQRSNSFRDVSVARNTDYFYRVVALRRDGMLTRLSDPKTGNHP